MENFILYALGLLGGIFTLYLIGILAAPYAPDSIKNDHFECGLPPSSATPKKANFGFFVFAIMFVVADMSGLFVTLFVYSTSVHTQVVAAAFAVILAMAIAIAMKEYYRDQNI
ncbi:MAG: NADH:ubiquinone oxidoreductase subunit A [Sulfurovum sp. FS08-3]|nr:MAG: NADH:ubiquinone oxidoreductase subunit A [Sulfurovum sp. FS08-3]